MKSVLLTAVRLRMDRAAAACAEFLTNHLDLDTCLEWRNLSGAARFIDNELINKADKFIEKHMDKLHNMRQFMELPRICVEVLHNNKEEKETAQIRSLCK